MSSDHVMLVPLLTLKSRPVCRGLSGSDVLDILRLSILHWLYYVETMLLWKSLWQMSPYGTLCSLQRIFVVVFVCRCSYLYFC